MAPPSLVCRFLLQYCNPFLIWGITIVLHQPIIAISHVNSSSVSKLYCNNQLSIFYEWCTTSTADLRSSLNHRLLQPTLVLPINTCTIIDSSVVEDGLTVERHGYVSIKYLHIKSTYSQFFAIAHRLSILFQVAAAYSYLSIGLIWYGAPLGYIRSIVNAVTSW